MVGDRIHCSLTVAGVQYRNIQHVIELRVNPVCASATMKSVAKEHIDELGMKISQIRTMVDSRRTFACRCHCDYRLECPILSDLEKTCGVRYIDLDQPNAPKHRDHNMTDWTGTLTVGLGWVYYHGPVSHTDFHRHYAVQICFPLGGLFRVETEENDQSVDNILVIGSNVNHRLSSPNATAKLLYIEPNLIRRNTAKLNLDRVEVLNIPKARLSILEQKLSTEAGLSDNDFGTQITSLIWPDLDDQQFSALDPRISKSLADIAKADELNVTLYDIVGNSGLSDSRFRHLFSAQVGMSLKSYLLWAKVQRAIQLLAADRSLTRAAHGAGFADSAHLSRTFRRTFGIAPADLNRQVRITENKGLG